MKSSNKKIDFDDILGDVGSFGKYQIRLVLAFLIPLALVMPWVDMNTFFMVYVPEHWCHVDPIASSNLSLQAQRSIIAPVKESSCYMYDLNFTEVANSYSFAEWNNVSLVKCDSWDYDTTDFEGTAATKWNMVCDRDYLATLVYTLSFAGASIGDPVYGTLSDKLGRKPVFFILTAIATLAGVSTVLVSNLTMFFVLRTINGTLSPSIFQIPYIILIELVGPSERARINGIINVGLILGLCILPLIAYLSKDWVIFGLVSSSGVALMLLYWKFLPESPRWLVSQKRYDEAVDVLAKVALVNGKTFDKEVMKLKLVEIAGKEDDEKKLILENTPLDLIRFPNLRKKFLIITLCWTAHVFAYTGLIINIPNLGGNYFLNFFLSTLVELPGLLLGWYLMENYGRRWSTVAAFIITATTCLCICFSTDSPTMGQILSFLGKFSSSASFFGVYQQSSELYPTTLRSIGMGTSGAISNIGNILVPFVVYLAVYDKSIPFLIIGSLNLMAAVGASFLPETLNEDLPLTIEDAEKFGSNQKYFSCIRKKQPQENKGDSISKTEGGPEERDSYVTRL